MHKEPGNGRERELATGPIRDTLRRSEHRRQQAILEHEELESGKRWRGDADAQAGVQAVRSAAACGAGQHGCAAVGVVEEDEQVDDTCGRLAHEMVRILVARRVSEHIDSATHILGTRPTLAWGVVRRDDALEHRQQDAITRSGEGVRDARQGLPAKLTAPLARLGVGRRDEELLELGHERLPQCARARRVLKRQPPAKQLGKAAVRSSGGVGRYRGVA